MTEVPVITGEAVVYRLSKKKNLLMLLATLCFIAASILIWMKTGENAEILPGAILARAAAAAGVLFFGAIAVYILFKLRDKKPGLIIAPEGIYNNTNATGPQMIPWKDILEIETAIIKNTKMLLVHVRNPEQYLQEVPQPRRFLMRLNQRTYGTPLSITTNSILARHVELLSQLQVFVQKYKIQTDQESV